jgi:hypothetical protein
VQLIEEDSQVDKELLDLHLPNLMRKHIDYNFVQSLNDCIFLWIVICCLFGIFAIIVEHSYELASLLQPS